MKSFDREGYIKQAYSIFCRRFGLAEDNYDEFEKKFGRTALGFLIDKNYAVPQLTKFTFNAIDNLVKKVTNPNGVVIADLLKMFYKESQSISHSNDYMYFCNSAVWGQEDVTVLAMFDSLIQILLGKINLVFKLHAQIEETKEYKTIINATRKAEEEYIELAKASYQIFVSPRINKETLPK